MHFCNTLRVFIRRANDRQRQFSDWEHVGYESAEEEYSSQDVTESTP